MQGWQRKSRKQFHRPALDADAAAANEPVALSRVVKPMPSPWFGGRTQRHMIIASDATGMLLRMQAEGLFVGSL